jgi:hypothetical protein
MSLSQPCLNTPSSSSGLLSIQAYGPWQGAREMRLTCSKQGETFLFQLHDTLVAEEESFLYTESNVIPQAFRPSDLAGSGLVCVLVDPTTSERFWANFVTSSDGGINIRTRSYTIPAGSIIPAQTIVCGSLLA